MNVVIAADSQSRCQSVFVMPRQVVPLVFWSQALFTSTAAYPGALHCGTSKGCVNTVSLSLSHTHTHTQTHMHTRTHTRAHAHAHTYTHTFPQHTHTCTRAHAHTHIRPPNTHTHTCTRTHAHTHTRARTHIHTYTPQHTHTRTPLLFVEDDCDDVRTFYRLAVCFAPVLT